MPRQPRKRNYLQRAAANARASRHPQMHESPPLSEDEDTRSSKAAPLDDTPDIDMPPDSDDRQIDLLEDCEWDSGESDCEYEGGVHDCLPSESEDYPWTDSDESGTDDDLSDFDDDTIRQAELVSLSKPTPYDELTSQRSQKEWKDVEKNRSLGYNGQSRSTKFRNEKNARDRAEAHEEAKTLNDLQIALMRGLFVKKKPVPIAMEQSAAEPEHNSSRDPVLTPTDLAAYPSDESDEESSDSDADDEADLASASAAPSTPG